MASRALAALLLTWRQVAHASSIDFDCASRADNFEREWSSLKKRYCCRRDGVGCAASSTTACHLDCRVGLSNWELGWSRIKKEWCCEHKGVGCSPTTTTEPKFHCIAEGADFLRTWTAAEQTWCCKSVGVGCTSTTTTSTISCHIGLNNWEKGWSQSKKEWCCKHEKVGCPATTAATTTATTVTSTAVSSTTGTTTATTETSTPTTRTATATTTTSETLTSTTQTTLPYDCRYLGGFWPANKKEWCCRNEGRGCTTTTETATQTATTATTTATDTSTTILPYDCTEGYTTCHRCLERRWTYAKRVWCCRHAGRGCTTTHTSTTATTTSSTTTSEPYDCMVGLGQWWDWSATKKEWCCERYKRGCPPTSTTTTRMNFAALRAPRAQVLTCGLNCFGARPVELPGSVGAGSGASLNDISLEECRNVCGVTQGCEAVLFTNHTRGVPWKSMCFGKRDVHTSKCQPGGAYLTELIGSRPWGKCAVFGDPHVITWDRVYGPPITMTDPGEYYLVKSKELSIHGRFGYTRRFPTASSTVGIAVGGPLIKDHLLVVTYVGPEQGYKGFRVFWDGQPVLTQYPSHFASTDGVLRASHDAMDPQKYHREGRHTIGGTGGLLPSYYFRFAADLNVYVLLGPDNCNAVIETRKVHGKQDGYCGNFNCDKNDDSLESLRKRGMMDPIPAEQSLFQHSSRPPAWVMKKVATPSMKDCDPTVKARAVRKCRGLPNGEEAACIFDACVANRSAVADVEAGVMALPFNCQQGQPASWAPEKHRWCCKRENVGCSTSGESHETSLQGCDSMCSFKGQSASCFARIAWAAHHTYKGKDKPCLKAHKLVLSQCDSCAGCTAEAVGCTGHADEDDKGRGMVFFKRLYEEEQAAQGSRQRLSGSSSARGLLAGVAGVCSISLAAFLVLGRAAVRRARRDVPIAVEEEAAEAVVLLEAQEDSL